MTSNPLPAPPSSMLPAFLGISLPREQQDEPEPPHPLHHPPTKATSTVVRHVYLSPDCTGPLLLRYCDSDGSSRQEWAMRSSLLPPSSSPASPPPPPQTPASLSAQPRLVTKEDTGSNRSGRYTTLAPSVTAAPGTVLMSTPALVAVVASPSIERVCHVCLRPPLPSKKILMCGDCHTVHYCSHVCYDQDEDMHQLLCLRLKRLRVYAHRRALVRQREQQQRQQQQQQQQGPVSMSSFDMDAARLALQVLGMAVNNFGKHAAATDAAKRKSSSSSSSSSSTKILSMPPPFRNHDDLSTVMALVAHKDAEGGRLWEEAVKMAQMLAEPTTAAETEGEEEGGREGWGSNGDLLFRVFPPEQVADLLVRMTINSHPFSVSIPTTSSSSSSSSSSSRRRDRTTPSSPSAQQQQQQQVQVLGLFPSMAGKVNHSCRPSAALSFSYIPPHQGGKEGWWWHQHLRAELRAVRGLVGGEEVTYSYLSSLHFSRTERRELLKQGFHFLCGCYRCEEEEKEEAEVKKRGKQEWACWTCGGRVDLVPPIGEEEGGERGKKSETKDSMMKCINSPRPCPTLLQQHHYLKAVRRGQALVAQARQIITTSFPLSPSCPAPSVVECMRALGEWLVSAGSLGGGGGGGGGGKGGEARLLADKHPLRCEAALLLMSMGQERGRKERGREGGRKTIEEEMAVAVAAGGMELFLVAKRLEEQPQRASFLVIKAKAMWALAQGMEGGREVWREALRFQACCSARKALGIYEKAWGKKHALTLGVERMVKEMEGGTEGGGGWVVEEKEGREEGEGGECRKSSEM